MMNCDLTIGNFDVLEYKNGVLKVAGWMLHPKKEFESLIVYINQHESGRATLVKRDDVAKVFPYISHANNSGFIFVYKCSEEMGRRVDICIVGVSKDVMIAKMDMLYVIRGDYRSTFRDLYGDDFIFDIDSRDEMYHHLAQHPDVKDPLDEYFHSGEMILMGLEDIFRELGYDFDQIKSFLDFACGYGRVTRFLIQKLSKDNITVSDIDNNAVDFCKKTFGVEGFYSVSNPSKLNHEKKYDVIFVASLFSHLALPFWTAWLKQLYNMLNSNGILIFSTHGTNLYLPFVDDETKRDSEVTNNEFYYVNQSETGRLSAKEYGTTYVSSKFVENFVSWNGLGDMLAFRPKKFCNFQDIYIIKHL